MQQALQRSSLVPSGFVESAYYDGDKAVIAVRAVQKRWPVSILRNGFPTCP